METFDNIVFDDFPREFSKNRIFVKNEQQFNELIEKWNKKIDCYATIYKIDKPRNYDSAIIDKLFFDIDGEEAEFTKNKLVAWLEEVGYTHTVIFSGGGYHVYVFCNNIILKNKRNTIRNAQEHIIKEAGIIGKVDRHVIGDIARISRIPGTWNLKRHKKCEMLNFYISQKFDLSDFDTDEIMYGFSNFEEEKEIPFKKEAMDAYLKELPPFIVTLLRTMRCGWRDRFYTIVAIKEVGLSKKVCENICGYFWTPQKFHHCVYDEKQIDYLYSRQNQFFPNWATVAGEGYKLTDEDYAFKFYSR